MILYGRNISPYVRRVAIWMALQRRAFERVELSPFDSAKDIAAANPMIRVPALTLDDGTVLVESWAICDWLDDTAPERRLIPAAGPARHATMRRIAQAHQFTDILIRLFYETERREEAYRWPVMVARNRAQARAGLDALEADAPEAGFFGGDAPDGADIAFALAHDFAAHTAPGLIDLAAHPRLVAHAARCGALKPFAETRP